MVLTRYILFSKFLLIIKLSSHHLHDWCIAHVCVTAGRSLSCWGWSLVRDKRSWWWPSPMRMGRSKMCVDDSVDGIGSAPCAQLATIRNHTSGHGTGDRDVLIGEKLVRNACSVFYTHKTCSHLSKSWYALLLIHWSPPLLVYAIVYHNWFQKWTKWTKWPKIFFTTPKSHPLFLVLIYSIHPNLSSLSKPSYTHVNFRPDNHNSSKSTQNQHTKIFFQRHQVELKPTKTIIINKSLIIHNKIV